ncbi:MAG: caspase family protein [Rhodobacteraceae bacterium]|nr:caspase family protein [Paracoccaceae bacterium]
MIISNARYQELGALYNTHADADAYAEVFEDFGYDITRLRDNGLDDTLDRLDVFLSQLDPGDDVAVVFSGHGWSDGQVNYLVPVDAPLQGSDRKLKRETIALKNGVDGVLDEIEARNVGLTVAIIDACRDNPFKPPEGRRSAGISRGLAPMTPRNGSFIVYSAGEGQQALDRLPSDPEDQKLSVFTRSFVPYLKQGLHLEEAISRAQLDTAALAQRAGGHRQEPAYYDAALGLTCISGRCDARAPTGAGVADKHRSDEADALLITALGLPDDVQAIALRRIVDGFDGTGAAKAADARLTVLERSERRLVQDSSAYSSGYWATNLLTLKGHQGEVSRASFSPDGTRIVTSSRDGTARIWDAENGRVLAQLLGHKKSVRSAAFSGDGQRLVTASSDGTAHVWKVETGQLISRLTGHMNAISSVSFSADGTRIVTASADRTARVWDAKSGRLLLNLRGHQRAVWSASFSADGARIATASADGTARIWNAKTGLELSRMSGHEDTVRSVSFSPDGTKIVTTSSDKSARIWNIANGRESVRLLGHQGPVWTAAFSPDGIWVVTVSAGQVETLQILHRS